jgi:NAD-dependent protein deacetylase sirtuin 6
MASTDRVVVPPPADNSQSVSHRQPTTGQDSGSVLSISEAQAGITATDMDTAANKPNAEQQTQQQQQQQHSATATATTITTTKSDTKRNGSVQNHVPGERRASRVRLARMRTADMRRRSQIAVSRHRLLQARKLGGRMSGNLKTLDSDIAAALYEAGVIKKPLALAPVVETHTPSVSVTAPDDDNDYSASTTTRAGSSAAGTASPFDTPSNRPSTTGSSAPNALPLLALDRSQTWDDSAMLVPTTMDERAISADQAVFDDGSPMQKTVSMPQYLDVENLELAATEVWSDNRQDNISENAADTTPNSDTGVAVGTPSGVNGAAAQAYAGSSPVKTNMHGTRAQRASTDGSALGFYRVLDLPGAQDAESDTDLSDSVSDIYDPVEHEASHTSNQSTELKLPLNIDVTEAQADSKYAGYQTPNKKAPSDRNADGPTPLLSARRRSRINNKKSSIVGDNSMRASPRTARSHTSTGYTNVADLHNLARSTASAVRNSNYCVFITGHEVNNDSDLPNYFAPDGFWSLRECGERAEIGYRPVDAAPTFSHLAVRALYETEAARFVITTNIDGIHRRSGIPSANLCELQGSIHTERCGLCHKEYTRGYDVTSRTSQESTLTGRTCEDTQCFGKLNDTLVALHKDEPVHQATWKKASRHLQLADTIIVLGDPLRKGVVQELLDKYSSPAANLIVCCSNHSLSLKRPAPVHAIAESDAFMRIVMQRMRLEVADPVDSPMALFGVNSLEAFSFRPAPVDKVLVKEPTRCCTVT